MRPFQPSPKISLIAMTPFVTAMLDSINPITREMMLSPPFPNNLLIGSAAK
jgi:hypothetical protein